MTVDEQTEARYRLHQSAKSARDLGLSMQFWMDDESVQSFCQENELNLSLLEHIACWTWTFRRRGRR